MAYEDHRPARRADPAGWLEAYADRCAQQVADAKTDAAQTPGTWLRAAAGTAVVCVPLYAGLAAVITGGRYTHPGLALLLLAGALTAGGALEPATVVMEARRQLVAARHLALRTFQREQHMVTLFVTAIDRRQLARWRRRVRAGRPRGSRQLVRS